jgi:hypothetical protein
MPEGKTCNGDCYCQYKTIGGTFFGCQYSGYCDFQAPRDSRSKVAVELEAEQKCNDCVFQIECCELPQGSTPLCEEPCTCGTSAVCKKHPYGRTR